MCIVLAYKHSRNESDRYYYFHTGLSPQAHSVPGRLLLIHQCPNLNVPSFRKSSCFPRPGSQPFLGLLPPQPLPFDVQDLEQLASQKRISADSQRARGTGMGYISHLGLSSEIPYVTIGWSLRLPETWSFPLNIPRFFHHSSDSSVHLMCTYGMLGRMGMIRIILQ